MKVLIVEDDELFTEMLVSAITGFYQAEVKTSNSGKNFLSIIEDFRPNLILLDLFLNGDNGLLILKDLKQNYYAKHIPVIVITGVNDLNVWNTAISLGACDYLLKPFNIEDLFKSIEASCSIKENSNLQAILNNKPEYIKSKDFDANVEIAKKHVALLLKSEELDVPVFPSIAIEIQQLLKDPQVGIREICDIIKQDVGLSSKIIRVANSSFYCAVDKIIDLKKAISRIGLKEMKNLVQILTGKLMFKINIPFLDHEMQKLWQHSLCCAYSNELVVQNKEVENSDHFFLLGLTHDVGKLFLFYLIAKIIKKNSDLKNVFTNDITEFLISKMHGQLGELMMDKWSLPKQFKEVARNPELIEINDTIENPLYVSTTSFSNLLSRKIGFDFQTFTEADALHIKTIGEKLNLKDENITEIQTALETTLQKAKNTFY
ncbi:MAG: hypothetical protein ACD_79C01327G0002 [uncultured bacterium]|nr:MAG: hypothetical protein ACD_79C01327G0002 [uncultured bacterium]